MASEYLVEGKPPERHGKHKEYDLPYDCILCLAGQ
jgi:hypothetical protein